MQGNLWLFDHVTLMLASSSFSIEQCRSLGVYLGRGRGKDAGQQAGIERSAVLLSPHWSWFRFWNKSQTWPPYQYYVFTLVHFHGGHCLHSEAMLCVLKTLETCRGSADHVCQLLQMATGVEIPEENGVPSVQIRVSTLCFGRQVWWCCCLPVNKRECQDTLCPDYSSLKHWTACQDTLCPNYSSLKHWTASSTVTYNPSQPLRYLFF